MSGLIGRNVRVEVSKTLGAAINVSAITAANPAVVTYTGSGPTDGDIVVVDDDTDGMIEIQGQAARVDNQSGTSPKSFELERLDASLYSTFVGPTSVYIVTEWSTLGIARAVNQGGASTSRIDATPLILSKKKYLQGYADVPEITVDVISDPLTEASQLIEAASNANTMLVFRITMSDGSKRVFRGYVSLPSESIPNGDLVTGSFTVTQVGNRLAYAS